MRRRADVDRIGGDAFALVWQHGELTGLNASGRAPADADPDALGGEMPFTGPQSVTVPGAVAGWQALLERHGTWGLDRCLADAIDAAERGFQLTPVIADVWNRTTADLAAYDEAARVFLPAPAVGATWRNPSSPPRCADRHRRPGRLLPRAGGGGDRLCHVARGVRSGRHAGRLGRAAADVASATRPCASCRRTARARRRCRRWGSRATSTSAALGDADRVHVQAEAMKLAFADAYRYIADEPLPAGYLDEEYLASRRALVDLARAGDPGPGLLPRGGTVYLSVVDRDRVACSFIQSLYIRFGSRVVAPGTGVMLQNRGGCFTLAAGHPNRLAPGRRPFHTIIPGMLLDAAGLVGPFGLMGGHVQPQGHLQLITNLRLRGLGPQAALDAPRWRLDQDADGWLLCLEPGLWGVADELERRGHRVWRDPDPVNYGGGQAIMLRGDELVGGSEPRKDGLAAGY